MEAISGRKTIQESLLTTPSECGMQRTSRCDPIQVSQWKRQLLAGASELFTNQGQEEQGQGGGTGQGGRAVPADRATADGATASSLPASQGQRSKDQAGLMPSQEVCMPRARHFIAFNFTSAFSLAHILIGGGREHRS